MCICRCNSALSEIAGIMALQATEQIVARHRATIAENLAVASAFFGARSDKFDWHPPTGGSIGFPRLLTGETKFCAICAGSEEEDYTSARTF